MAITFSQICLPVDKEYKLINPAPDRNIIGSDILSRNNVRYLSDYLYIGKTSHLPPPERLDNCNLVLLEDKKIATEYFQINTINMLITTNPEDFKKIKDWIRDVFDTQIKINNYAYNLLNMCQRGASVKEIFDAGYAALGNPILLLDASLCLIDHSGAQNIKDEPIIEQTIKNGYITQEYFDEVMEEHDVYYDVDFTTLIIWEKSFLNHRLIAGRIIRNNQLLGYIKLFECNRPVTDLDKQLLIILCKFMSIAIAETSSRNISNNSMLECFLITLLENKIHDKNAVEERAKLFNLVLYDSMVAITVEYSQIMHKPDVLYLIKKRLQSHFNKNTIVIFKYKIVILLDSRKISDTLSSERMASFEGLLKEINCRAGISMPFTSISDFYNHYQQTIACLEIMNKLAYHSRIAKYADCKLTHMFLYFSQIVDLNDLISEDVKLLLEVDKEKDSDLVETLFCYIRHRQDITSTAEEMHLHYNTIKYRINRIIEVTNIDFDDYQKMYNLIISEKTMDLIKQLKTTKNEAAS
jgi:sugar diacid utilization regulator